MKTKILIITTLLCSNVTFAQNSFPSGQSNPIIKLQHSLDGTSAYGYLEFHDVNSRMGYVGFGSSGNNTLHFDNETGGNFYFLNGNIGIGTGYPGNFKLAIHGTSDSYSNIKLTNDGNLVQGLQFGNVSFNSNDSEIWNYENGYFRIATNNIERLMVSGNGNVGIGISQPLKKLDVRGNILFESGTDPIIYTGSGSSELNRYVKLINSNGHGSASGLKTGGALISDTYSYANPGKNDLIVKGKVGIGTTSMGTHKLAVDGTIGARRVIVEAGEWSDFVFKNNYELPSLEEVESHIKKNGHLKNIPNETEVAEDGINLGDMDAKLLQKIEELTLYLIEQNKRIDMLETKNTELEKEVLTLKNE